MSERSDLLLKLKERNGFIGYFGLFELKEIIEDLSLMWSPTAIESMPRELQLFYKLKRLL